MRLFAVRGPELAEDGAKFARGQLARASAIHAVPCLVAGRALFLPLLVIVLLVVVEVVLAVVAVILHFLLRRLGLNRRKDCVGYFQASFCRIS